MPVWKHLFLSAIIGANVFAINTANAEPFSLSPPVGHGNMKIYFVRGKGQFQGRTVLTLDTALRKNQAEVTISEGSSGVMVRNMSNADILVPFGTMIRGALQDQVVGTARVVPSHSGPTYIATFCVDPFRSSKRDGESAKRFSATNLVIPSLTAKLSFLAADAPGKSVMADKMRQSTIWWSIDTLQQRLSHLTENPLQPIKSASWIVSNDPFMTQQLRSRDGTWINSLPLALEDQKLADLERPISADFAHSPELKDDIVGAVFTVSGWLVSAEVFKTNALFKQMWPALLRSFVIESLAGPPETESMQVSSSTLADMINHPRSGEGAWALSGEMQVGETSSWVTAKTLDSRGQVEEITYLPKIDATMAPTTPDVAMLQVLMTGKIAGTAELLNAPPALKYDTTRQQWVADRMSATVRHLDTGPVAAPRSAMILRWRVWKFLSAVFLIILGSGTACFQPSLHAWALRPQIMFFLRKWLFNICSSRAGTRRFVIRSPGEIAYRVCLFFLFVARRPSRRSRSSPR